jgi:PadR family transcriptional regulator, regulatory protein PadR
MLGKRSYQNRLEVLQGTLDMLILKTLQWGPQHGFGIVQALRANSGEMLQIETGSRQGWVRSDWKQTDCNQPAKFYRITVAGKKQLAADLGRWQRIVEAVTSIIDRKPEVK